MLTSAALAARLTHLSPEAARQAIRRATHKGVIWRSKHLVMPSGARLFARRSFVGQEKFLLQIRPILQEQRPGIARVLDQMLRYPGIHPDTVTKLLAATLEPKKHPDQRSVTDEMLVLEELGIGVIEYVDSGLPRFVRRLLLGTEESLALGYQLAGQKLLDEQLTKLLVQNLRNQNIISWGGTDLDSAVEHSYNGQWFSASGYSWLRPIVRFKQGQEPVACPAVFDVRANTATLADVQAFVTRIRNTGYRPRSKLRVLGIMGARFFEPDAFDFGKKSGLILVNFHEQIGDAALDALAAIDRIISAVPDGQAPRADFLELFTKLRHHPQVKELASIAFEAFTAAVIQADSWQDVHTNFAVKFQQGSLGTWRDVDVMGRQGDHHRAIECKAYAGDKPLELGDVTKFFKQTVPSYLKHFAPLKPVKRFTAEIWTTGIVTDECRAKLRELQARLPETHTYALRGIKEIEVPNDIKSMKPLLNFIADL